MATKTGIQDDAQAWESGELGNSEEHAVHAPAELEAQIEEALGLKAISIRLPVRTISMFKAIASLHRVGYQPLMRDALARFAEAELKRLVAQYTETSPTAQEATEEKPPSPARASKRAEQQMKKAA